MTTPSGIVVRDHPYIMSSSFGVKKERRKFSDGMKKEKGRLFPKIVAYLSCSAGRTHFARTKFYKKNLSAKVTLSNNSTMSIRVFEEKLSMNM